jgi:hypothetical protein
MGSAEIMIMLPFLLFWILVFMGREELGIKWILVLACISVALVAGFFLTGWSPFIFVGIQVLIDIILIMVVFGGNIDI